MTELPETLDLFGDAPLSAGPLPILEETWGAVGVHWTAYKGARRLCDHCTKRIHQMGAGAAPHPRPATRKRKGPNGDAYLCAEDAETQKARDHAAEVQRKERLEQSEHASGRRGKRSGA